MTNIIIIIIWSNWFSIVFVYHGASVGNLCANYLRLRARDIRGLVIEKYCVNIVLNTDRHHEYALIHAFLK